MSLLKNSYSGLITKGLGLPACAGLMTMGFGVFKAQIEIIPKHGGGGGGQYPVYEQPLYHTPMRGSDLIRNQAIQITVKFSETKTWRQSYLVTDQRAKYAIKVINIVNKWQKNISTNITNITNAIFVKIKNIKHSINVTISKLK